MTTKKDKPLTVAALVRANGLKHTARSLMFERDLKVRAALLEELGPLAEKGLQFERTEGSRNAKAQVVREHVEALVKANPGATREALFLAADRAVIETMPRKTFFRYVTEASRSLGIERRAGRPRR